MRDSSWPRLITSDALVLSRGRGREALQFLKEATIKVSDYGLGAGRLSRCKPTLHPFLRLFSAVVSSLPRCTQTASPLN